MGDKPSDNRRRISDNLLDEIEEFDGKDFSEQLLKWKNDSDELSQQELEEKFDKAMNRFKDKVSYDGHDNSDSDIDYAHIESLIEKHTDKVVRELGR